MRLFRSLVLAPALLPAAFAQEDIFEEFISDALSVYTQITSALGSFASEVSLAATALQETTTSPASASATTSDVATSQSTEASPSVVPTSTDDDDPSSSSSSSAASTASGRSNTITSAPTSTNAEPSSSTSSQSLSLITLTSPGTSTPTTSESSSLNVVGASSVQGAAADATADAASQAGEDGSGGGHNTLAIVLGTVLGALALGLLILALLLCRKRRRGRGSSVRHSALSPGDDELESWRRPSSNEHYTQLGISHPPGAGPLMSEHPAYRSHEHQNPFVPVPPPPRRSAPNARAGLTDASVPGDAPFLEKETRPTSSPSPGSNAKRGLAAGLAGAALGAGMMHRHKRDQDDEKAMLVEHSVEEVTPRRVYRKPVPVNKVNNSEAWPYSPVSPLDPSADFQDPSSPLSTAADAAGAAKPPSRASAESRRSFSRDAARANAAFDSEYAPEIPTPVPAYEAREPDSRNGLAAAGAALLGAGALAGGGALALAHDRARSRSSSSSRGRRPPITTNSSDHSSSSNDNAYADALTTQTTPVTQPIASSGAHPQSTYDMPRTPESRSRRNSGVGVGVGAAAAAAIPAAAAGAGLGAAAAANPAYSYTNRPAVSSPLATEYVADRSPTPGFPRHSPHRATYPSAFVPDAFDERMGRAPSYTAVSHHDPYGHDQAHAYPYAPGYAHPHPYSHSSPHSRSHSRSRSRSQSQHHAGPRGRSVSRPRSLPLPLPPPAHSHSYVGMPSPVPVIADPAGKSTVGDNGYPHLGVPRRKSGGDYDYSLTGHLGPQVLRVPRPLRADGAASTSASASRRSTMSSRDTGSWRGSEGMPGAWRRENETADSDGDVDGEVVVKERRRTWGRSSVGYAM